MIPTAQLGQFGRTIGQSAPPAAWRTLIDWTADTTGSNSGWNNYTLRTVFDVNPGTDYPGLGGSGTKIRIKLLGGGVTGFSTNAVYVGEGATSGDVYDFAATPTQVTWGGSGAISAGAITNTAVSDEIAFVFDGTKPIVLAIYFNATTYLLTDTGNPGFGSTNNFYVSGNSASTVNASTGQAGTISFIVSKLEVYG